MAGDFFYSKVTARWSGAGVGTNAGVTVTKTGVANVAHSVAGIQFSSDAAAVVTVESPAATILFKKRYSAAFNGSETFAPGCIVGPAGADLLVKISASTTNSEANIQGFSAMAG